MAYLLVKGFRKQDLRVLAQTLGVEIEADITIKIVDAIVKSPHHNKELSIQLLLKIIKDREKVEKRRKKQEKREYELEKLKILSGRGSVILPEEIMLKVIKPKKDYRKDIVELSKKEFPIEQRKSEELKTPLKEAKRENDDKTTYLRVEEMLFNRKVDEDKLERKIIVVPERKCAVVLPGEIMVPMIKPKEDSRKDIVELSKKEFPIDQGNGEEDEFLISEPVDLPDENLLPMIIPGEDSRPDFVELAQEKSLLELGINEELKPLFKEEKKENDAKTKCLTDDGMLFYRKVKKDKSERKIAVPENNRDKLKKTRHEGTAAHLGVTKTKDAKKKQKLGYDEKAIKRKFRKSDIVLVRNHPNKLSVQRVGQASTKKQLSETKYVIKFPVKEKTQVLHINMQKKYYKHLQKKEGTVVEHAFELIDRLQRFKELADVNIEDAWYDTGQQNTGTNPRLLRWALALQHLNFSVEHKSGKTHLNADTLSRVP